MIKNDSQYQVTCKALADFRASLALLEQGVVPNASGWLYDEQLKTVKGEKPGSNPRLRNLTILR
jgi:hypothetical protein